MGNCFSKDHNGTSDFGDRKIPASDRRSWARVGLKDFKIKSLIGSGSTSKVFLAMKIANSKHYAIKIIQKSDIKKKEEIKHINAERKMLEDLNHPFLIKFYYAFQTGQRLHLILEFAAGGDLFTYLMKQKVIPEEHCKFYAAEILLALEYLHKNGVIFRGLKPEDVLLDSRGHVKLTDFGLAKSTKSKSSTFWGSPLYLAPEIIKGEKQTIAVDFWSFGVLLYEMMCGKPPFWDHDGKALLTRIINKDYEFESNISDEAKDLISKLLNLVPNERLGCGPTGINDIKDHKFFEGIDWHKVLMKGYKPPFVPLIKKESDVGNIDPLFTKDIINQYQSFVDNSEKHPSNMFERYSYIGRQSGRDTDNSDLCQLGNSSNRLIESS